MDNDRANIILHTELPHELGVLEEEALSRTRELYTVLPRIILETAQPVLLGSRVDEPKKPLLFWDLGAHGSAPVSRTPYVRRATQYRAEYGAEGLLRNPVPGHHNFFDREKECRLFSRYLLPIRLVSYSINMDSERLEHGAWTNTIGHIPIPNELLRTTAGSAALGGAEPYQLGHLVYRYLYNCTAARTGKSFASSTLGALLDIGELGAPYSLFTDSMGSSSACGYILRFYPVVEAGSTDSSLSALFNRSMGENCIYAV